MSAEHEVIFWGNACTAFSYYIITAQLLYFMHDPKILKLFATKPGSRDSKKRSVFRLIFAIAMLFASFIFMCGNTHSMHVLNSLFSKSKAVRVAQSVIMTICAVISVITAVVGFRLFPLIAEKVASFEFTPEGEIQHPEAYLVEVVELIKESILILSSVFRIVKGNGASRLLFGDKMVGTSVLDYIHVEDQKLFVDTANRVMNSYNFTPATIEVRIKREIPTAAVVSPPSSLVASPSSQENSKRIYSNRRKPSYHRVYCADDSSGRRSAASVSAARSTGTSTSQSSADDDYLWIECTLVKGKRLNSMDDFEYDLKMVTRNVDDRKKRALYQNLVEGTEERGRINESKLRYLSCIAHDLKTPLQSFCFTLDLLGQSNLLADQREYVQQANVAVDLMKLTISQTMDISKALSGAKLLPRRTTVYLSLVLQRVKIIINGYGKQVPVSFEVAPDVCDEIITDEEWLWQMLLNLLTNACKYTDKGSIRVRLSIKDDTIQEALIAETGTEKYALQPSSSVPKMSVQGVEMLLCEVIDTGVGISPEKIDSIFDAFAQVQDGQVTGTGLGLFGVRTRAEGLQGTCGARHNTESSTGSGTVLWFAIPYLADRSTTPFGGSMKMSGATAASVKRLGASISTDTVADSSFGITIRGRTDSMDSYLGSPTSDDFAVRTEQLIRSRKLTAMVVEDTLTVRKLMEKLLISMGFDKVQCYENGSKGLDAMMAEPVDIVFSDVQMPIMTGPEMITRFRRFETDALQSGKRDSKQLVVAVTANGAESGGRGENGFDEICPKPLTRNDICRLVNSHFAPQSYE